MEKRYTILLIVYILVLMIFAALPSINVGSFDKAAHMLEFFIFAVLCLKALSGYKVFNAEAITILLSILLIIATEGVQLFIPTRTFSYRDMLADFAGVLMAIASKWIFRKQD